MTRLTTNKLTQPLKTKWLRESKSVFLRRLTSTNLGSDKWIKIVFCLDFLSQQETEEKIFKSFRVHETSVLICVDCPTRADLSDVHRACKNVKCWSYSVTCWITCPQRLIDMLINANKVIWIAKAITILRARWLPQNSQKSIRFLNENAKHLANANTLITSVRFATQSLFSQVIWINQMILQIICLSPRTCFAFTK